MNLKKVLASFAAVSLVLVSLVLPVRSYSQTAPAVPPAVTQQKNPNAQRHERHPHIKAAIRRLERVKDQLQKDPHDFGGHRVQAIEHINQAIQELQAALQADKK